jgi:hypothetical protein
MYMVDIIYINNKMKTTLEIATESYNHIGPGLTLFLPSHRPW